MRRAGSASFVVVLAIVIARTALAVSITGKIVDEQDRPFAGIQVDLVPVHLSNCCSNTVNTNSDVNGDFRFEADAGTYALLTRGYSRWNPAAAGVDARTGNVTGIRLKMKPGLPAFIADDAPRAALISATPGETGLAHIAGAAGSVPPSSYVTLVTLETGDLCVAQAGADGSFVSDHMAPAGTAILIKADPIGLVWSRTLFEATTGGEGNLSGSTGTILHVPHSQPPSTDGSTPFAGAGLFTCCAGGKPMWTLTGTIDKTSLNTGDEFRLHGTMEVRTAKYTTIAANVGLTLEPVADDLGSRGPANAVFSSAFTTPAGFPIERGESGAAGPAGANGSVTLTQAGEGILRATVDLTVPVPAATRPGWYRPRIHVFSPIATEPRSTNEIFVDKQSRHRRNQLYLPVVRIGAPPAPSLHWALLLDKTSEGAAGVNAIEDRGRFGFTNRIAMQGDTIVVPRVDPYSGETLRYRLEPFLPQVSVGDRGIPPAVPFIPFKFPSGRLTMRVHTPRGAILTAGPSPFVQSRMATFVNRLGDTVDQGGGHLSDPYQLTTRDPAFEVAFTSDGLHIVELEGEIEDLWGNHWSGKGTYRVMVARPIPLDSATIPGTQFETGDWFHPGIAILGWSSCDADVDLTLAAAPGGTLRHWTIGGKTNRFGVFQPADAVRFDEAGEYRAELSAVCTDASGNIGAGTRAWGGVVADKQPRVEAHGRRGIDGAGEQWFLRSQSSALPIPQSHVEYPFLSGDVAWMQKRDATTTSATFQDLTGSITPILRSRFNNTAEFDRRASIGELPLFSSAPNFADPIVDPTKVDVWGYSYRSAQRPLIRVREQVTEDNSLSMYWRFNAQYGRQSGIGANGDLPNDFKFQFAGTVLRGSAIGAPVYAIYGSLFVLVPEDDPRGGTRVFPPFQGNGGGPSGGPLFKLKGKEIDLFFHPTAVRAGTILQRGGRASFAGYSAPTLPSKIEIVVTSPSGTMRTIRGQANRIGYFYDPSQDFTVNEPGVWKAKVKILFDGRTAGGQVTQPFPSGDVLGSREGEFFFYVVDASAPPLEIVSMPRFVRPADGAITFTIKPPAGLTNVQLTRTTTMPGFILEEAATTSMTYRYDAPALANDFPNLDLHDAEGFAGADIITMSFLVSGTDANNVRRHFARQIVLQGEELLMPEQKETIGPSRRRSARH
jgi:hypothetical protein